MFQCPLCRQVANLTASVSTDSLLDPDEDKNGPESPNSQDHITESPNSADISDALNPDNHGNENLQEETSESAINENHLVQESQHQRPSSAQKSNSKKPSLSMKLAELMDRSSNQTNSSYIDTSNGKTETTHVQPPVPVRLTPRSETPHFIRPSPDHARHDSADSIA
jgi:hypothetical protein